MGPYGIVAIEVRGCAFQVTAAAIAKGQFAPACKLGPSSVLCIRSRVAEPIRRDRAYPRVLPLLRSSVKVQTRRGRCLRRPQAPTRFKEKPTTKSRPNLGGPTPLRSFFFLVVWGDISRSGGTKSGATSPYIRLHALTRHLLDSYPGPSTI